VNPSDDFPQPVSDAEPVLAIAVIAVWAVVATTATSAGTVVQPQTCGTCRG
jgi:hypothetical protein